MTTNPDPTTPLASSPFLHPPAAAPAPQEPAAVPPEPAALQPATAPPAPAPTDAVLAPARPPAPMNELAAAILRIIRDNPGVHFRGVARQAGLNSAGQLRHHLDRLKRQGHILELEDGRYKRFFAAGDHEASLRPGMARFSRPLPRLIGKLLLARPMNRTELRRRLGCADSTLGYHLNRMMMLGDLEKQRSRHGCQYALTDQELVRKVLLAQPAPPGPSLPEPEPVAA